MSEQLPPPPPKPVPEPTEVSRGFWDAFQGGRLVAQFCTECGKFQHYPRPICGRCWGSSLEWRNLAGTGKIYTFAIVRRGPSKEFSDTPYAVGMVDLDEGIRMMARIGAPDLGDLHIGDPVHVIPEKRGDMVIPSFEKRP